MSKATILWADDEIEFLEPHVIFLENKGYTVIKVTNGDDAIAIVQKGAVDLAILDESMPGRGGLDTLTEIKQQAPHLPVIMVTKNEEEQLMEEAIGFQIDDYLTKPVNPSQILLACKKVLETQQISEARLSRNFSQSIATLDASLAAEPDASGWLNHFQRVVSLSLDADRLQERDFQQYVNEHLREANRDFARFIKNNYSKWMQAEYPERPLLSVDIVDQYVVSPLKQGKKVVMIVIDGMRLDQWMLFEEQLAAFFRPERELYYSILPTATPYARNAIFSGLFPADLHKLYADVFSRDEDENSANRYEKEVLTQLLARRGIRFQRDLFYTKIFNEKDAGDLAKNFQQVVDAPLSAIVFNFVDILAHSRSDLQVLKEIAPDEPAFRSLTMSWFGHSAMFAFFKRLSAEDIEVIITSDHGSIRGLHPVKIVTDKDASHNLRYKFGRNLKTESKAAIRLKDPSVYRLPRFTINSECIIAVQDYFFVYQQNYNKFVNLYRDCFQHGGVSLEEMIVPVVRLRRR
jgi:DNA-binding response OmpR family regulator